MGENLLANGNFEADWSVDKSHRCFIFPVDGEPYEADVGNVFTPSGGWVTWFRHDPGTWDQPEVRDAWASGDPHRVHAGLKATLLFTFYRKHDAGFLQRVEVRPGSELRFTAWAHAWSNTELEGHEDCLDDGRCSCGVGRQIVSIAAEDVPPLSGDSWNDALGNIKFVLGIDPNGGNDPSSPDVVWGPTFAIYNGYARELEVEAAAGSSGMITVFMRSFTLWPFKHNDAYWDDAELVVVDGGELPSEERGKPRIQYDRTYVLLPPDAGQEWALAIVDATWDDHRYTLGGSADDAGIGDLDVRRAIAVNPTGWGDELREFFTEHYPGIEYVPVEADTPERLRQILAGETEDIALSQRDPRWANKDLGEDPGGETIGQAGCLLTGFAMCLRHAGHWIYPDQLNIILADAEIPFTNDDHLTDWGAAVGLFDEFDGFAKTNTQRGLATLEGMLGDGWEIVLRMPGGSHFVYLESVSDDGFLNVIDPWDGQRKPRLADQYVGIRAAHRTSDTSPPPPSPDFTLRGVHDMVGGQWLADSGLPGWCTVAGYVGTSPRIFNLPDNDKVRHILRLSYSYATDDGGEGTMPPPDRLHAHEQAIIETMRQNPKAWGFVYGNEPNNQREWHGEHNLTPQYYLDSYQRVWSQKPAGARLSPAAIDPYNPGWGDWRQTWKWVLDCITGCDFLAMHAYTHGPDPALILGKAMFGDEPLVGVYYDMRVLESQIAILPTRFSSKPRIVTETNHWIKKDGSVGWEPDAGSWVQQAFSYLASRGVAGGCLFRHGHTDWAYGHLPQILQALKDLP